MNIEFPLIGISKHRKGIRTALFSSIPILILLQFLLHESGFHLLGWIATGTVGLALIISFIVIRVYSKYEVIGDFKLNESSIVIFGRKYELEKIESLAIYYKSYKGEPSRITFMGYNEGEDNLIKLRISGEEVFSHFFKSTNKNDYMLIEKYLTKYAKAGVSVYLKNLR
jgi:hypothetical protein